MTLLAFSMLFTCAASFAQTKADVADTTALFGYDPAGQSKWKDTWRACGGTKQSPIDISTRTENPNLPQITFQYKSTTLKFETNPYNLKIDCKDTGNQIVIDGKTYKLKEFHFHRPAEEMVSGQRAAMSIHFVHQNVDPACDRVENNPCFVVVAVEVLEGKPDPDMKDPMTKAVRKLLITYGPPSGEPLDLSELLPADKTYFRYQGSLTTPPCTENITWYVLRRGIYFPPEQIAQFAARFPSPNARETQPANGRVPTWKP
jgi:carbonic anhydrase